MGLVRAIKSWLFDEPLVFPDAREPQAAAAPPRATGPRNLAALALQLSMSVDELRRVEPRYVTFSVAKRAGGRRTIHAPAGEFKAFQQALLRRLLARLPVHPAATAFEPGCSIARHAMIHAVRPVVVRLDIRRFFHATTDRRVHAYFRRIGWDRESARLLTRWTTLDGGLPQGAPTSPKLANAVNVILDARITAVLRAIVGDGGHYSRYADDITLSFDRDDHSQVWGVIGGVQTILADLGYVAHRRKRRIMRRHDRQLVTGLVVNDGVRLPRRRRRQLRAVEHHLSTGRPATMSPQQLAGWRAFDRMVRDTVARGSDGTATIRP